MSVVSMFRFRASAARHDGRLLLRSLVPWKEPGDFFTVFSLKTNCALTNDFNSATLLINDESEIPVLRAGAAALACRRTGEIGILG